ncbi:ATP-binding cassette domain-containing protein [Paenibacillus sinopodophylli]|uniref:ATP-binding cassette domain-containing protein n=1 Tax=Paenibacillus sinopodophylli TaxID=1837342 RepID=UPI00110CBE0D|nr:ATP-binding cassette domain-containing protein [Paenibacillus sinopodophylli]
MQADWKLSGLSVTTEGKDRTYLLHDVNMAFKAGEITLLIGRNGAGKSTLLETMAGLRPIAEGEAMLGDEPLWIDGKRKKRLNRSAALRLGIAMQNSESQWFAATVREELLYSLKPYAVEEAVSIQRIEQAINRAGLPQELLERDPWTLSGGQQRRLSLACLLACEPEWLLLDEPTAGLDAVGIRRLCAVLEAHRAAGRGAVVATHDLDALLPLADAVAVVSGGTVRAAAPAAAIAHAADAPQALRALAALRAGAALPPGLPAPVSGAPWPAPRETALAIAAELKRRAADERSPAIALSSSSERSAPLSFSASNEKLTAHKEVGTVQQPLSSAASGNKRMVLRNDTFDPRALVLVYLFLAACLLAQKTAVGLLLSAMITCLLAFPLRAFIRPWVRVIRAYIIMIIIFCIVAGIAFNPLTFDAAKAWPIALRFGELLLVMILGMPMLKLMTPYRLQRAIEQTFGWLERLKLPIHSFALIVTLIFRFIPLLTGEWERFAKLAHARGKSASIAKSVPFNRIVPTLIPYVRSILRLAEQMADALEARGFGYARRKPVYAFRLQFGRADAKLAGTGLISGLLLLGFAHML